MPFHVSLIACAYREGDMARSREELAARAIEIWAAPAVVAVAPHFPCSREVAQVGNRCALSAILHAIRNGLRWRDAPAADGGPQALCDCFVR